jgi:DNA polymerase elongation subunit (family B)
MYQNVHYDSEKREIHIWDDKKGYSKTKYSTYAYVKDGNGSHMSIYGDRLKKVTYWKDVPQSSLFESDVNEVTRYLIDTYGDSDDVSENHCILTFDIEVEMNTGLPDTKEAKNEITAIAFHDSITNDKSVYVVHDGNEINKTIKGASVRSFNTESDMLSTFLNKWEEISPTIITGWNIDYFDVTYLYNRLKLLFSEREANRLSPIGKVKYNKYRKRYRIAGVSALDYMALYKNFTYNELPNYRLDTIAKAELDRGKIEYEGNLDQLFRDDIEKFIEYNLVDVELVVDLDKKLQFIDLARAICHSGHVGYEDFVFSSKWIEGAILTLLRRNGKVAPNRSDRFEFKIAGGKKGSNELFVKEFPKKISEEGKLKIWKSKSSKFIVSYKKLDRERNCFILDDPLTENVKLDWLIKIDFEGAYVKAPIPGLYKWVYDLDLTSLYPSIIMSINISPETKMGKVIGYTTDKHMRNQMDQYIVVDIHGRKSDSMDSAKFLDFISKMNLSIASNGVLYTKEKMGVIPEILDTWFKKRVEYKDLMKQYGKSGNDKLYKFYNQRQLVQKIMLNSLYGVLGLESFRFFDIDNAEATTLTGQTIIKTTELIANQYYTSITGEEKDYNIYVDTDSVFYQAEPLVKVQNPNIDTNSDEQMIPAILKVAEEVQSHINGVYNSMAKTMFNIEDHRFDIKQETIAKGGFWVSKKRYAQWIINDNTVNCDKLDVKGLDVKRSSFPTYFKEVMSTVLWYILKNVDKSVVDTQILAYKDDMPNKRVIEIAKNSAVKDMSKHDMGPNSAIGHFKKGTPAHVKSAMTYNKLLTKFKAPYKYEPMKDGDKVKWVYLKPNPLGLNTTAINGYNDPPEIEEFVSNYIDYDLLWEKELENKLDDFYSAMNWEKPNPSLEKASEFFDF